jgi:hypothetical protein
MPRSRKPYPPDYNRGRVSRLSDVFEPRVENANFQVGQTVIDKCEQFEGQTE